MCSVYAFDSSTRSSKLLCEEQVCQEKQPNPILLELIDRGSAAIGDLKSTSRCILWVNSVWPGQKYFVRGGWEVGNQIRAFFFFFLHTCMRV